MLETIVAIATPMGRGGIGIIRVSGPAALAIAQMMLKLKPKPRYAHYLPFYDAQQKILDRGIALYFPAPHSFTGEDILELQGHGGSMVLDLLLEAILSLPIAHIRIARPGEFSERAFLNGKLDLVQAEAIADLIDASSKNAAQYAINSLQGLFSKKINQLIEALIQLRVQIEASIDFPDEEIDTSEISKQKQALSDILEIILSLQYGARQGCLLREGVHIAIAGLPNAGKSSLLNALVGSEAAIVTNIPGTTRDIVREKIEINGVPIHIIDTAGLRETDDKVEKIGIVRAWETIKKAQHILFIIDSTTTKSCDPHTILPQLNAQLVGHSPMTIIRNKADLSGELIGLEKSVPHPIIRLSAHTGEGISALRTHLSAQIGIDNTSEGGFIARRRHLNALATAQQHLEVAQNWLATTSINNHIELIAEELRLAQNSLNSITGSFTSDDLLGEIFSTFCIGK